MYQLFSWGRVVIPLAELHPPARQKEFGHQMMDTSSARCPRDHDTNISVSSGTLGPQV